jgi:hypothetical protein
MEKMACIFYSPSGANGTRRITFLEFNILYTIAIVLGVLWLLGLVSSYTLGGYIHVLIVLAVIVTLLSLIQVRRQLHT